MKKNLFLAIAASCICMYASAFKSKKTARTIATTGQMEQTLTSQFGNYQNAVWAYTADNKIEASLIVAGQPIKAFFSEDHEYLFSTMDMKKENLPMNLQLAINKSLPNVYITSVMQVMAPTGTSYYFIGNDSKCKKIWKGTANGDIEVFKKTN